MIQAPFMGDFTQILDCVQQGDPKASEELFPLVYDELRRLAAAKMTQQPPGHTLQATALVHEAFIRLSGTTQNQWQDRIHFFRAPPPKPCARCLIDRARAKQRVKRGAGQVQINLDEGGSRRVEHPPSPGDETLD